MRFVFRLFHSKRTQIAQVQGKRRFNISLLIEKYQATTFFQMHASGGSGYCDCGDLEAWKRSPYCAIHKPSKDAVEGSENKDGSDLVKLPEADERRIGAFIAKILQYAIELVCWDYCDILPAGLVHQ